MDRSFLLAVDDFMSVKEKRLDWQIVLLELIYRLLHMQLQHVLMVILIFSPLSLSFSVIGVANCNSCNKNIVCQITGTLEERTV